MTIFEVVGGEPTFKRLVDIFYARVEADPVLRPLFPEDLSEGKRWQYLFLMQLFGGDTTYSELRGHPKLRWRHMPFKIDQQARDHWLEHMLAAVDEVGITDPARAEMHKYFENAATHMINVEQL
ncbi:MAG: globin [Chloroflexi bacterium]|nr:globin [Chloroflexota bacterium]